MYNEKSIKCVRSCQSCYQCGASLYGKPAISVYDGYESSHYFCPGCEYDFENEKDEDEVEVEVEYEDEDEI